MRLESYHISYLHLMGVIVLTVVTPDLGQAEDLTVSSTVSASLEDEYNLEDFGLSEEDLALSEDETLIGPVTVLGQRGLWAELAGSVYVVEEEELERFEYDDVGRVLKQVPGVYLRDEEGFGLRPNIGIRGVSSDRSQKVTLLEDGVLLGPAPYSAPAAYYFPMTTRMVGLDVLKGAAAIQHGPNTIGGAINLRTQPVPFGEVGMVDVAGGSFGYMKGHARWGYGEKYWGVLFEGVQLRSSGFQKLPSDNDTGFDKQEVMGKVRLNTDPDLDTMFRLDVKLGYSQERSNATYLGLTLADFEDNPDRRYPASELGRMDWDRFQIQVGASISHKEELSFRLDAYQHDFDRAWRKLNSIEFNRVGQGTGSIRDLHDLLALESPSGIDRLLVAILRGQEDTGAGQALRVGTNSRAFISRGLQFSGHWDAELGPSEHRVVFGVRYHNDKIERNHTEQRFDMRSGTLVAAGPDEATATNKGESDAIAVYLLDDIKLWDRLTLSPGIRAEFIETTFKDIQNARDEIKNNVEVFIPGIGALFQVVDAMDIFAGIYRGFSAPPPSSVRSEPELSTNYEAGLRLNFEQSLFEAVGFFNDYSNITAVCTISLCGTSNADVQFSAGSAEIYGFELQAKDQRALTSWLSTQVQLNYSLTMSQFTSDFDSAFPLWGDVQSGYEMPYTPNHQLSAFIGIYVSNFDLGISYSYVSPMRDVAGDNDDIGPNAFGKTDPQHIVDLSLAAHLVKQTQFYLRIDNVFNDRAVVSYRPYGARPTKPLSFQIGLKTDFSFFGTDN